MKKIQQLFILVFLLGSITATQAQFVSDLKKPVTVVKNERAKIFLQNINNRARPQIIDIRTPQEYKAGHIKGAVLINFYDPNFAQNIEKAGLDKQQPIYIYCRSGSRSGHAINIFKKLGFKEIHNLVFGINEWNQRGMPIEK